MSIPVGLRCLPCNDYNTVGLRVMNRGTRVFIALVRGAGHSPQTVTLQQ